MKSDDIARMNNDNIFGPGHLGFIAVANMLREIAYQLAVMNERVNVPDSCDLPTVPGKTTHTFRYSPEPRYGCPHDPIAECKECRRDRTFGS